MAPLCPDVAPDKGKRPILRDEAVKAHDSAKNRTQPWTPWTTEVSKRESATRTSTRPNKTSLLEEPARPGTAAFGEGLSVNNRFALLGSIVPWFGVGIARFDDDHSSRTDMPDHVRFSGFLRRGRPRRNGARLHQHAGTVCGFRFWGKADSPA